jgi:hypothetical protein
MLPCLVVALAGCSRTVTERPSAEMAGMSGMLSVERFMQASNAQDFDAMSRLFGTVDGSWAETGGGRCGLFRGRCMSDEEIEIQMSVIAEILRHEDYRIASNRSVPGRNHPATRFGVDITQRGNVVEDVGFTVVRTGQGLWLVEMVELEKMVRAP